MDSRATKIFALAIAIGLLYFASPSAVAQEATPAATAPRLPEHSFARKLTLEGVPNFGEISPTLYRGGQPTKKGFQELARAGIAVVVDLREGDRTEESEEVTQLAMRYVSIPWMCWHPSDQIVARFLAVLRESAGKKVFVHCREGIDRTGLMIAAYRIAEEGWTAEQARQEMREFGFVSFHRLWCSALFSYEQHFPQEYSTSPAFESLHKSQAEPKP